MNASLWSILNGFFGGRVPRLDAEEWALVALLLATAVVLVAVRETFLRVWTAGWIALAASRLTEHALAPGIPAPFDAVVVQATFVLAVGLLAGSVLWFARSRELLVPLAVITPILVGFAGARVLLSPDSLPLRVAVEVGYRIVLLTAGIALLRARRGRFEPSSWLLALSLLTLHLEWWPFTDRIPAVVSTAGEFVLGGSMLCVVLNQARMRARRLQTLQSLTQSFSGAQAYGNLIQAALEELRTVCGVRGAWFRLLEGERLTVTNAVGLSADFVRNPLPGAVTEEVSKLLIGEPQIARAATAPPEDSGLLAAEHIRQVVQVPVTGNKSAIGLLLLGYSRSRQWTPDEISFLVTCAKQLAIAVENSRLLEQVLRSQRQWMNTFDSVYDVILAHDNDFKILKANQVLLEQLGKAPADVIGHACDTVLPHAFAQWTGCPYCNLRGDTEFTEGADPCFGGFSAVSTSSYAEQGSEQRGILHIIRDISERRSAEEKYRLLFEQVQEGVFIATPAGRLLDCNDALVHMLGYTTREELFALNLNSDVFADSRQQQTFQRELDEHNHVRDFEITLRRKDGSQLVAVQSGFARRDEKGNVERYQGFILDITEKHRAEDEMRRRNRELNALNAMAVVAAQSFDLDEILNLTLRQVVTLFASESGTVYLSDTDSPTYRRRAAWGPRSREKSQPAEICFDSGFGDLVMRSRTEVITAEYLPHLPPKVAEFLRSDAERSWIWVLFWGKDAPVGIMGLCTHLGYDWSGNEENLMVAISRQLATTIEKVRLYEETCRAYEDLRKTQEQLLQSEKMSAVGQLIAGVAHELNNPLTAILGYAQLLESEGLNSRAQDYVSKLFKQAQRTHRVVQNLLSFARQRKPQRDEVDICKVLDETLALRDYDLKTNHIQVERETPDEPAAVIADPHQIEQVFLNIINNAVDAILETGRTGKLRIRIYRLNGQVCTQFADDGPGIKDPKRIFDPFYTTKSVGKGTGLGLSICYGIVKEHGGDITANNAPEGGAVIEVRLPAEAGAAPEVERAKPVARPHEGAVSGRILLVEEEEAVLEFERDVLAGAGASVVTASSSADVKTRLLSEQFEAIIMAGRMTGDWNARESHAWLKTNCPTMAEHVLFTFSNAVEQGDGRAYLQENSVPYLVKPFEVAELISQARKLLQKPRASAAGAGSD
jgi:PAS domain S-box-containing protein